MNFRLGFFILFVVCFLISETEGLIPDSKKHNFKKCTKCPPGWGVGKRCTSNTDTQCDRCITGKTYSSHWSSKSPCWSCSKCGIGLYEAHECSPKRDTICNECISYLDHKNITHSKNFLQKCTYVFL